MKVIYKYTLGIKKIIVPKDYVFRHVGEQEGAVILWIEHAASPQPGSGVTLELIQAPTGYEFQMPEGVNFAGTAQMKNGLVWHIYYREI